MSITSASTQTQVLAQYNDNLVWEGSPSKAVLALEAVRWLLVNRPAGISGQNRSLSFESLQEEKKRLEEYVLKRSTSVNRATFTRGQMLT